jgi:hypothetical protein
MQVDRGNTNAAVLCTVLPFMSKLAVAPRGLQIGVLSCLARAVFVLSADGCRQRTDNHVYPLTRVPCDTASLCIRDNWPELAAETPWESAVGPR